MWYRIIKCASAHARTNIQFCAANVVCVRTSFNSIFFGRKNCRFKNWIKKNSEKKTAHSQRKNKWNTHKSSVDFVEIVCVCVYDESTVDVAAAVVRICTVQCTHLMTEYIKNKWKQDWIMRARGHSIDVMMSVYEPWICSTCWHAHSLYLTMNNQAKLIICLKYVCLCVYEYVGCLANTVYRTIIH